MPDPESIPSLTMAIVTNLPDRNGVGKGRRFDLTPRGIEFHGDMEWDQIVELFRALKTVREGYDLCMASLVKHVRKRFGIERAAELLEQLEFSHMDAMHALAIGQLEFDFRPRLKLTAEHLWVLASAFPDRPDEQERWANLAEVHDLTALALKRSIEAGRVLTVKELETRSGRGSGGIGFLNGLQAHFEQWERKLGGRKAILELDPKLKEEWLESVAPIEQLIHDVRESLKGVRRR